MIFPSKVDAWLLWSLWGSGLLCLALLPATWRKAKWSAVLVVGVAVGMAWGGYLVKDLRYELADGWLRSHMGPFHDEHLRIDAIEAVRPSRDTSGAPASSLDRLEVLHHTWGPGGRVLVSPEDKAGFLDALRAGNPALRPEGDGLVRGP